MTHKQQCKSCGAAIRWYRTPAGKRMPVDAEPASDGNLVILAGVVQPIQADLFRGIPSGPRYISHFATCPNARKHRRKK